MLAHFHYSDPCISEESCEFYRKKREACTFSKQTRGMFIMLEERNKINAKSEIPNLSKTHNYTTEEFEFLVYVQTKQDKKNGF